MKRIFNLIILSLAFCFCLTNVKADNTYFVWHNSMDNAYTTNYDGKISSEVGKYQNGTIESLGGHNVKLNNFNAYDVMVTSASTWNINGSNTINAIEEGENSIITITGTGSLKFKTIGLSMTDMLDNKTENLEQKIKTYLKGDYTLSIEGQYIITKLNSNKESNEVKEEKPVTNENNNKNTNKEETSSKEELNKKEINFENKEHEIIINSSSKVPSNTIFVVKDLTMDKKEEIVKKLSENEQTKYIYDLTLLNNEEEIEPDSAVEVKIKLEEANYNVYHYNDGKSLEKISSEYKDGYLVFKTSHFSNYVITETKESQNNHTLESKEPEEEKENKKSNPVIIYICVSIAIIIIIVGLLIIKKKKLK